MTVAYDPKVWTIPFRLFAPGSSIRAVLFDPRWYITLAVMAVMIAAAWSNLSHTTAMALRNPFGYIMGVLASIFSYQITNFTGNCHRHYNIIWGAAMTGWGRLNDLGLQCYSHLVDQDYRLACEVMRLVHAANHYVYLDYAGQVGDDHELLTRRGLVTQEELEWLQRDGRTVSRGYQCATWALKLIVNEVRAKRLDPTIAAAMEESLLGWRGNTTYLPMLAQQPVPFAYFHTMAVELIVFQLGAAAYLVVLVFSIHDVDGDGELIKSSAFYTTLGIAVIAFAFISLFFQALMNTALMMFEPWGEAGLGLPAEEYLLSPLATHKDLFAKAASNTMPEAYRLPSACSDDKEPSIFLQPFCSLDANMLASFAKQSSTGMLSQLSKATFRPLDSAGKCYVTTAMKSPAMVNQASKVAKRAHRKSTWERAADRGKEAFKQAGAVAPAASQSVRAGVQPVRIGPGRG